MIAHNIEEVMENYEKDERSDPTDSDDGKAEAGKS